VLRGVSTWVRQRRQRPLIADLPPCQATTGWAVYSYACKAGAAQEHCTFATPLGIKLCTTLETETSHEQCSCFGRLNARDAISARTSHQARNTFPLRHRRSELARHRESCHKSLALRNHEHEIGERRARDLRTIGKLEAHTHTQDVFETIPRRRHLQLF